jgi:hypothetical protein
MTGQAIPSAAVVLFAEPPAARIARTDMFRVSSTDRTGKFQIRSPPGGDWSLQEGLDKDAWLGRILFATKAADNPSI